MKLVTTDTEFHRLEKTLDETRASTEMVKVPRVALQHLMNDHSDLVQRAAKIGPVETRP